MGNRGPKPDEQAGEKLFRALRELEVAFLDDGRKLQVSLQGLLKKYNFTPRNEMGKYLIEQSIVKKDLSMSTHKKPWYYYNGPRLNLKVCNEWITGMRLNKTLDEKEAAKPSVFAGEVHGLAPANPKGTVAEKIMSQNLQSIKDVVRMEYESEREQMVIEVTETGNEIFELERDLAIKKKEHHDNLIVLAYLKRKLKINNE